MSPFPSERFPIVSAVTLERAEQLVQVLRDLVRCDAIALTAADPFGTAPEHKLIMADGYSEAALKRILDDFVPDAVNPAYRLLRDRVRAALRWSDLARDWEIRFDTTSLAEEYLLPAGFHEGLSASLWLPDGSHVGAIHMNWEASKAATDDRRHIVEQFRPLLAGASNLLQPHRVIADEIHPDAHVAVLGEGLNQKIPGRDVGPTLRAGEKLWSLLSTKAYRDGSYLLIDDASKFHRIELNPCAGSTVLVSEREVPPPYGLTAREMQIVTMIASGASNPEIADALIVSRRTVSTHVEHILEKLGAVSRAEVAARASREGLRLIQLGLVS